VWIGQAVFASPGRDSREFDTRTHASCGYVGSSFSFLWVKLRVHASRKNRSVLSGYGGASFSSFPDKIALPLSREDDQEEIIDMANETQIPTKVNHSLYLRRRNKIVLPESVGDGLLALPYVASVVKDAERLGYAFSPKLMDACRVLSLEQLTTLHTDLIAELTRLRGAHRTLQPMYPNFPAQVMEMSECELYMNAILHYWTDGRYLPPAEAKERYPLLDEVELTPIDLGNQEEFETLFAQIVGANTALSEQDREDVAWFVTTYGDEIGMLLPAAVPQKENMAYLASRLLTRTSRDRAAGYIGVYCQTATDILRLAVALSGGDVSLATPTKFRTFSRPERNLLLALIDRLSYTNAVEDMLRWKGRWIRLGEKLHPGELAKKYPNAARAFQTLRNDEPFTTFNGFIEKALTEKRVTETVARLSTRPGDFARRLDHLLRLDPATEVRETVLAAFADVAGRVSTPVLLQVRHHFAVRGESDGLRVFLPKGSVAKAQGIENNLPELPSEICAQVIATCETALTERFSSLPPLGKVYVDPDLTDYMVPFALRSASKSLRTLVRGSRLSLPPCDVLRFFVWWKNGPERTDIDLSATLFDAQFNYIDVLSYYNLKGFGGVHSGDIVDAPEGASEFIDVTLANVRKKDVRYVVMTLTSYTQQPYIELPECFAGWMGRQKPGSGEVFEPGTVQDRLDITADTRIAIPLIIDVQESKVIWCDLALRNHPNWQNNVAGNLTGIQLTLRSLVEMKKPNLYDLFRLHAQARGTVVVTAEEADTVFSVGSGTPFRLDEIAAQYMG
jgi:hypothetical protein